jgi:NADH-quinone oxidoreductase subunit G
MTATASANPAVATKTLTIDGIEVPITGERNLLELIRKAQIDLPTFCYHSELSVYGACRLCIVDIEGRGVQGACSTPPEPGLKVRTQTSELRSIRKITIELLLANHDLRCPTCPRNGTCQLQSLARRLGVDEVRFKNVHQAEPIDRSSPSLIRDGNRCVLCGDCVRVCSEVQGIGAIDFAFRGHDAAVLPAFGTNLGDSECVNCGQCASVCPTGALAPASEIDQVWNAIHDPKKKVVAQVAPAVRVAIGEAFGMDPGEITTGQIVAALRRIGFDLVYDTCYTADLTVIEEANEFLGRAKKGERLPLFTSCCPAWVKFAEQYYPELLPNLSTCRSPQQMLGSLCKAILPEQLGVAAQDVIVVSIMPCTAKKFEARRPEFARENVPDVDLVITTQELARMIEEAGIHFRKLEPGSFDMPMGFKTGAGPIFGVTGGVTEAVLRYAAEAVTGQKPASPDFHAVRGFQGVRFATVPVNGTQLRLAVVNGLQNARNLIGQIKRGEVEVDLVEVMACPGGCIVGGGQPLPDPCVAHADHDDGFAPNTRVSPAARAKALRAAGLYRVDKLADLHHSQENHFVTDLYTRHLGEIGGHRAHELLHTHYQPRRRAGDEVIQLSDRVGDPAVRIDACVGTSCFTRGSQGILQGLLDKVERENLHDQVQVCASFCTERCEHGPNVKVGAVTISQCTLEKAARKLDELRTNLGAQDACDKTPGQGA